MNRKRKPQTTVNNKLPSVKFNLMHQDWRSIAWACRKDGFDIIADSIVRHIAGHRHTEHVEIAVPVDSCRMIASACANHDVGQGRGFSTAASSHYHEKRGDKPVDQATVAAVREEFEGMKS